MLVQRWTSESLMNSSRLSGLVHAASAQCKLATVWKQALLQVFAEITFVNSPCSFLLCIQACLFVIHVIKINKWCTFWSTTYTKVWTFYFAWLTWRSSMGMSVDEWLTSKSISFFETSAKRLFNTGAGTLNQQNKSITPSQSLAQWPLWTDIAVLSHLVIER